MISVDRGPFEMIPHWLLHSSASSQAIRLYLLLRKHGNKDGVSFPGRRRLAEQMNASMSTVDRSKAELVSQGAICENQRMSSSGDWTSNEYHIHWSQILSCSRYIAGDSRYPASDDTSPASDDTGYTASDELTYTQLSNSDTITHTFNDQFDEFWSFYPRKAAKQAAKKAWVKTVKTVDPDILIEGAKRYSTDPNREDEFTAHASTWINDGRWEDEPLPSSSSSGTKTYVEAAEMLNNPYLELEGNNEPF